MRVLRPAVSALLLFASIASAAAQTPDANGDYFSNETPVLGKPSPGRSPGSLWRTLQALGCRKTPDTNSPILRNLAKGTIIEAEVWRGGSDEVLVNPVDKQGKPWMAVRGKTSGDVCYVRARKQNIQPLKAPP
jgi:hypothetical protein